MKSNQKFSNSIDIISEFIEIMSLHGSRMNEIQTRFEVLSDYAHPDLTIIMPTYRKDREFYGKDGWWQIIKQNKEELPDLKVMAPLFYGDQSKIAVHFTVVATHSGDFIGIPLRGKVVETEMVYLFKFSSGKLIEIRALADAFNLILQAGQAVVQRNQKEEIDQYLNVLRNIGLIPRFRIDQ
jgi:predicted ester cyclase